MSANDGGPVQITVSVAPWAAAVKINPPEPTVPALAAPDEVIIEPNAPKTNKTQPAPELSSRDRLLAQVRAGCETAVYEVSANPSEPPREIARVSQARGVVKSLSLEQKLENKLGGRREPAPETTVNTNFNPFRGGE